MFVLRNSEGEITAAFSNPQPEMETEFLSVTDEELTKFMKGHEVWSL